MPSRKIKEYIAEHSFCSEYLFKDWESFLDLLYVKVVIFRLSSGGITARSRNT